MLSQFVNRYLSVWFKLRQCVHLIKLTERSCRLCRTLHRTAVVAWLSFVIVYRLTLGKKQKQTPYSFKCMQQTVNSLYYSFDTLLKATHSQGCKGRIYFKVTKYLRKNIFILHNLYRDDISLTKWLCNNS